MPDLIEWRRKVLTIARLIGAAMQSRVDQAVVHEDQRCVSVGIEWASLGRPGREDRVLRVGYDAHHVLRDMSVGPPR